MRLSTFGYTLQQGFKNIVRNKIFSLATVATIGACIFLFGLFYSVIVNLQHIVLEAQAGVAVTVFFDEGTSDERIAEIGDEISKRVEVKNIHYVSAEEAWDSFKDDYLGEYVESFGDDNPLADSSNYEIYLNDVSMQDSLVTYLESMDGIRTVNKSDIIANVWASLNSLIGYVSVGIIAILLAVSIFLISNTVAIGITVRREEIGIMKLIGATDFVVRSPFVIEGIILGLVGSIIPLIAIYYIYNNVIEYVIKRFDALNTILQFLSVKQIFSTLIPISLVMGVGIGFIGSFATTRKHLKV